MRRTAIVFAVLLAASCVHAQGKNKAPKRELDPDAPEAQALAELLKVDPRYAKDGTVELIYTFANGDHVADWDQSGDFDKLRRGGKKKKKKKKKKNQGKTLHLTVGSQDQLLIQHRLHLAGSYEVVFECTVRRMTESSDIVFVVGKAGALFGSVPVELGSRGLRKVSRGAKPARDLFAKGKRVRVKLVSKNDELTIYLAGKQVGTTTKLEKQKLGRVGVFASKNVNMVVHRVEIRGEFDRKKL